MTCPHPYKALRKTDNGEVCCSLCGLVVSDFEFDPGFTPPTSIKTNVKETSNTEKTIVYVTYDALRIAENLHLPASKNEIKNIIRKVAVNAKKCGHRFTKEQLAVFAVYEASRLSGRTISIKEYCDQLENRLGIKIESKDFFRLQVRVRKVAPELKAEPPTVKECIQNIAVNLKKNGVVEDEQYLLALERYAYMVVEEVRENVKNRNPWLIAAAAILAADVKLARTFEGREEKLAFTAGLKSTANILRYAQKLSNLIAVSPKHLHYIYQSLDKATIIFKKR